MAILLYMGWTMAGALAAIVLTFLVACAIDPHGNGPVGEGLLFLAAFVLLLPIGIVAGCIRASVVWRKRYSERE